MYSSSITMEALLVLDAIERRGSFAGAAEQLNKVPSALSYIVQKLEENLSVTLFVRQGRRSVLTPAGRHLLEEGRKLLGAVSKLSEQTQTIAHGWEPKIRIAIDSIFDIKALYPVLKQFLIEHPNIEIDISEQVMSGSWEALIEDSADLIIGAPEPVPNQQGLRAIKLFELEHALIVPKDHELTQLKQPIAKKDIQSYRTVVVHDSAKRAIPWSSNLIERSLHLYVTSVNHKIEAIKAGLGVGFLPINRVESYITSGELVAIEVDQTTQPNNIYMAWKLVNKGKGLKRLHEMLAQHLIN
ncbi:LysR substrate-binding domain-containing protein [Colwellia sp. MEBiC06753]